MKESTNQERLKELFDADPRSDSTIADALGVSKQTLSAWRNGSRSPSKKMIIKISETFDVSLEWLMGYDHPRERPSLDDPSIFYGKRLSKKDDEILDRLLDVIVEYAKTNRQRAKNILLALMEGDDI